MKLLSPDNSIITISSKIPGKTIAVFSAIHGNETVGVLAINELLKNNFQLKSGTVHFVLANPSAFLKGIRQCDINLNRIFLKTTKNDLPEEKRVHELMKLLDECDALLDIHAFNSIEGTPFIIGNESMKEYAKNFPYEIFSYGWDTLEPGGTNDYMQKQNKPALCLECGPAIEAKKYQTLAVESILIFLSLNGLIKKEITNYNQKSVHVYSIGVKKTETFYFAREYKEFESLQNNEIFAVDGDIEYRANDSDVIIFPRPQKPIGGEVFLLGTYK